MSAIKIMGWGDLLVDAGKQNLAVYEGPVLKGTIIPCRASEGTHETVYSAEAFGRSNAGFAPIFCQTEAQVRAGLCQKFFAPSRNFKAGEVQQMIAERLPTLTAIAVAR